MKEIIKTINGKEKAFFILMISQNMKATSKIINLMGKEFLHIKTVLNMKEILKMERSMEKAQNIMKMGINM